jgi:hypothetical protein
VGFALLVVPWTSYWDRNYFHELVPAWRDVLTSPAVRGATSGLGLVNIAAGVAELVEVFATRPDRPTMAVTVPPSPPD